MLISYWSSVVCSTDLRLVAADEFLDEIEGLQRMVKTIDVDLVAKSVAVFVRALEQRIFVRLHIVIAVKVGVGADADMVDADQLCDMEIGRASGRERVCQNV